MSLSKDKKRFNVATTDELESTLTKVVPKNTTTLLNWVFHIFKEWVEHSGNIEGRSYVPEDLWMLQDHEGFSTMITQFLVLNNRNEWNISV